MSSSNHDDIIQILQMLLVNIRKNCEKIGRFCDNIQNSDNYNNNFWYVIIFMIFLYTTFDSNFFSNANRENVSKLTYWKLD